MCPIRDQPNRMKVTTSSLKSPPRAHPLKDNCPKVLHPYLTLGRVLKRLIPEKNCLERPSVSPDEQPLALVKRIEKPSDHVPVPPALLQQMRPSVITCISRPKMTVPQSPEKANPPSNGASAGPSVPSSSDVEEHFQRSLASCYKCPTQRHHSPNSLCSSQSTRCSVEDHFSKALGSQWLLVRAADSASSVESRSRSHL
ncbi:hypothetical protein GDO86_017853 [Hymenochirus boettgeri]|nr:hypothetical protein GDO86_017853 [Hymenochirus boettgeri]